MAYDPATGNEVLFGGGQGKNVLADTWTWNGTMWSQLFPANMPQARYGASLAYDPATRNVVLFGGRNLSGPFDDTWTWDGVNWTQQNPVSNPPFADYASLASDPATNNLVLYAATFPGTDSASTWTWDGSNWTKQSPAVSPPNRVAASMTYDPATGTMVLFGGEASTGNLNDTWTWDGSNWTKQSPSTSPPVRADGAMTFDPSVNGLVLFGGYNVGFLGDTWAFDGSNWIQQAPVVSPSARAGASMNYDASTGKTVLFGGGDSNNAHNDTWIDSVAPLIPPTTPAITNLPSPAFLGSRFTPIVGTTGDGLRSVTSSTPSVCFLFGSAFVYPGVGTCTLTAHVARGTYYAAADGTPQSFTVTQATPTNPTISNLPAVGSTGGLAVTVSTTGDGIKSVTSSTTSVCTASVLFVSYVGLGTCTLTAHVAAGTDYAAADGTPQSFVVNASSYLPPFISRCSPTSGAVGTTVTITGTNLLGATKVTVHGVTATITKDFATKIKITVPVGATTGKIKVITLGGTVKSATTFTVT